VKSVGRVAEVDAHYVIGSGDHGQLGVGDDVQLCLAPKKLDALDGEAVARVHVGHNHSVAVLADGRAKGWGYNLLGQCGVGHRDPVSQPTALVGLEGRSVRDVSVGPLQTWLLTENLRTGKQAVWHCGAAYADERPDEKFTAHTATPRKVKKRDFLGAVRVQRVIPAADFCLFLTEQQRLYVFGSGLGVGALGQGERRGDESVDVLSGPTVIPALDDVAIADAAVGWGHAVAVSAEGELYAWGSNAHGQLGLDLRSPSISEPRIVPYFSLPARHVKQVACGETHCVALDISGNVHSWGSHAEGKLGLGEISADILAPRQIHFFDDKEVVQVAAGVDHCSALTSDGVVYVWGFGQHGALSGLTRLQNAWTPFAWPPAKFYAPEQGRPDPSALPADYPFIVDGVKVSEAEFFDSAYTHTATEVQCGMDLTLIRLRSTLKGEFRRQDE